MLILVPAPALTPSSSHVFAPRLKDDGQIKQPIRLLPVLEAADPGAGPVGARGPGPDGGAGPERRRERRFLRSEGPGGGGQSSGAARISPVTPGRVRPRGLTAAAAAPV